jgi:hypothetical protein
MTLAEQLTWTADQTNKSKVRQLLLKAAVSIMYESDQTVGYELRRKYAKAVLGNPVVAADIAVYAVATNSALTFEATDSDIEFTIGTMINAFAGV